MPAWWYGSEKLCQMLIQQETNKAAGLTTTIWDLFKKN